MSKILISLSIIVMFCFSLQSLAMSNNVKNSCLKTLKFYDENYLTKEGKSRYTLQERLDYLSKIGNPCVDLDYAIIYKANTLFEMNKHQEALAEIDRGLELNLNRKGNLLYSKANYLYMMKSTGFKVQQTYQELIELLKLSLKSDNDNPHLVHLTWAEIAIEIGDKTGDYDEAVEHVIAGNNIKTVYRFYTLFSIIAERLGEYEKAVSFISDAVKSEGTQQYLLEADTVLSLTKSLCALGIRNQAIWVVENAYKASDFHKENLMIKDAAKLILDNCPSK